MDKSDIWELIDYYTENGTYSGVNSLGNAVDWDHFTFNFMFRRKPQSYVYGIFIPCTALMIMQLCTTSLPPDLPERALFSITINLAFFIVQISIGDIIPKTSNALPILSYIAGQMGVGAALTIYFLISCHFASVTHAHFNKDQNNSVPESVSEQVVRTNVFLRCGNSKNRVRTADIIVIILSTLAAVVINVTLFAVILPA
jgi:hypothetical protein